MTAEPSLISAQSHHSIHQLNRADHTGKVAALFRLARRALQASEALEKQITLVDVFVVKGVQPLFMGFLHDSAGLSAGDPPCFGNKGSKFREADALVDLSQRPFMALLLLLFGDSLAGNGYLQGSG